MSMSMAIINHSCPQCPQRVPDTGISMFLILFNDRLPPELRSMVVSYLLVPPKPCLDHLFHTCLDQWGCQNGAHKPANEYQGVMVPCPVITSLDSFFHLDGYWQFFRNHTFVFEACSSDYHAVTARLHALGPVLRNLWTEILTNGQVRGQGHRNIYATRLLEFLDRPDWVGKGSRAFRTPDRILRFQHTDTHRRNIRHMVFMADLEPGELGKQYLCDWDWMLKINWSTLPILETLVLDLRSYSFGLRRNIIITQEEYDSKIRVGARAMECLNLNLLVIRGLCSGIFWQKPGRQRQMESLFEKALADHV
ncbi:hypothetical protein VTL71DRAFT_1697 [Oculimacula yallundae]|uniref:Uncharacterized protein n=1 Tax=Oculimacula yallundae TaxID=86028 RepID=A0ABR4CBE5_9HELO